MYIYGKLLVRIKNKYPVYFFLHDCMEICIIISRKLDNNKVNATFLVCVSSLIIMPLCPKIPSLYVSQENVMCDFYKSECSGLCSDLLSHIQSCCKKGAK